MGLGADIAANQDLGDILRDYGAQAVWASNVVEVLQNILDQVPLIDQDTIKTLEGAQQIFKLSGMGLEKLGDLADVVGLVQDANQYLQDMIPPELQPILKLPDPIKLALGIPELPTWLKDLPAWLTPILGMQDGNGSVSFPPPAGCPLVLDLDGDGVEVTKLAYGATGSQVRFDMDNDGFAERTAWVTGGDGMLAIDLNGNGVIDNQSELFGNDATYADGFAKLSQYDLNEDHQITAADAAFSSLRVWVDANGDGYTDAGELKTLAELGITQINVNATSQSGVYANENEVAATGTFTINGQSREVADVWFRLDQTNSIYTGDVTLDVRTLFLPTLKGFGNLADLHVVMSSDETLLTMMENLVSTTTTASLANMTALDTQVRDILFRWAGVDVIAADAVFHGLNARQEGFLEKITGVPLSRLAVNDNEQNGERLPARWTEQRAAA